MKKITYLLVLIPILTCSCQSNRSDDRLRVLSLNNLSDKKVSIKLINKFIDTKMVEMNIPGLSVAIINDGQVVYHDVKGYADLEEKKLVTNTTLFEGASLSKPVFAYMTMVLVEKGLLDLDKPLYEYIDYDYHGISHDDKEKFKKITARMALSHTTGFPNWRSNWNHLDILNDPGSVFSYSGEGYMYLARVIESILDTNYQGVESYFQKKVATPLNMGTTKYVQDEFSISQKAVPYNNGESLAINKWEIEEFNAASAIHSEALDFSKWLISLLNRNNLSEKAYDELFMEQITIPKNSPFRKNGEMAWTLGFTKYEIENKIIYGHIGNNLGFTSLFLIDINKKWGMIVFNNAHDTSKFGFDLFKYINNLDIKRLG